MEQQDGGGLTVVYVDHVARWSGGEIALANLLQALEGRLAAHVILGEDGDLVPALERIDGVTVEIMPMTDALRDTRRSDVSPGRVPLRTLLAMARYVWRLHRRLKQIRPDVVHTNSLKAALYGGLAGRLARVPVLWHVRDRISSDYLPAPAVALVRWLARWLPTGVVSNSASTLSTLPAAVNGRVLYNAMPATLGDSGAPPAPRQPGPLRVGVIGRLADWKGQHVFLEAFARAFPAGTEEAWLVGSALFGESAYESRLRRLAEDLKISDRVVWRGFRSDVASELAQLDILVHCSITPEPFGQVVVEGMAAGLAVIASADGGPSEIIDDGRDGVLLPAGDADALAAAMRTIAQDSALRAALGRAAKASCKRFSPERAANDALTIYRRLIDGKLLRTTET